MHATFSAQHGEKICGRANRQMWQEFPLLPLKVCTVLNQHSFSITCINCLVPKLPKMYFRELGTAEPWSLLEILSWIIVRIYYVIFIFGGKKHGEWYLSVIYTALLKHRSWQCKFTFHAKLSWSTLLCAEASKPSTTLSLSSLRTYKRIIK